MNEIQALELVDEKLKILNQTKLPLLEEYILTDDYERIAIAIERLEVRGAPAIGIAAAYAIALSTKNKIDTEKIFRKSYDRLLLTRPTAVNLFYALEEMKKVFEKNYLSNEVFNLLLQRAIEIHNADIQMCYDIGKNGLDIFKSKYRVLTHCNTGSLATGGEGTALNVIKTAFKKGLIEFVYVDETRPLFQGSRLTAWELNKLKIPFSINTDSTAAVLMNDVKVDLVITGADRIACNGDTANKIGTYNLAVLCNHHKIPFYIAAPSTTIDYNCSTGKNIKIEMRDKKELIFFGGQQFLPNDINAYCPAFDITPNHLITGIITEKKIHKPPFDFKNV
jgi:methylthioribose-1-phosphate isomerase